MRSWEEEIVLRVGTPGVGSVFVASVLAAGCGIRTTAGDGADATGDTGNGPGTTAGTAEGSGDSTTSDGCEDLFDDGEFSCHIDHTDWCAFLAERPNRVARWSMELREDPGGPEDNILDFERKVMCIEAYLDGIGVEHQFGEYGGVDATATYAQVEPLCRASMIGDCAPRPLDGECESYGEDECELTPWCEPLHGQRIEPGASCYVADVFGACIPAQISCGNEVLAAKGPDGACWLLLDEGPAQCVTEQPGWEPESPDCPTFEQWDTIPECG
jgi:hypothetical protein